MDKKITGQEVKVELLKPIVLSDSDQEHDVGDPDLRFTKKGNPGEKKLHYEGVAIHFSV